MNIHAIRQSLGRPSMATTTKDRALDVLMGLEANALSNVDPKTLLPSFVTLGFIKHINPFTTSEARRFHALVREDSPRLPRPSSQSEVWTMVLAMFRDPAWTASLMLSASHWGASNEFKKWFPITPVTSSDLSDECLYHFELGFIAPPSVELDSLSPSQRMFVNIVCGYPVVPKSTLEEVHALKVAGDEDARKVLELVKVLAQRILVLDEKYQGASKRKILELANGDTSAMLQWKQCLTNDGDFYDLKSPEFRAALLRLKAWAATTTVHSPTEHFARGRDLLDRFKFEGARLLVEYSDANYARIKHELEAIAPLAAEIALKLSAAQQLPKFSDARPKSPEDNESAYQVILESRKIAHLFLEAFATHDKARQMAVEGDPFDDQIPVALQAATRHVRRARTTFEYSINRFNAAIRGEPQPEQPAELVEMVQQHQMRLAAQPADPVEAPVPPSANPEPEQAPSPVIAKPFVLPKKVRPIKPEQESDASPVEASKQAPFCDLMKAGRPGALWPSPGSLRRSTSRKSRPVPPRSP